MTTKQYVVAEGHGPILHAGKEYVAGDPIPFVQRLWDQGRISEVLPITPLDKEPVEVVAEVGTEVAADLAANAPPAKLPRKRGKKK